MAWNLAASALARQLMGRAANVGSRVGPAAARARAAIPVLRDRVVSGASALGGAAAGLGSRASSVLAGARPAVGASGAGTGASGARAAAGGSNLMDDLGYARLFDRARGNVARESAGAEAAAAAELAALSGGARAARLQGRKVERKLRNEIRGLKKQHKQDVKAAKRKIPWGRLGWGALTLSGYPALVYGGYQMGKASGTPYSPGAAGGLPYANHLDQRQRDIEMINQIAAGY